MASVRLERRKGQSVTVEEVMYMGIGIMLVFGTFGTFQKISDGLKADLRDDSAKELASYIAFNAENLALNAAEDSYVELEIPKTIGGENYLVAGDGGKGLLITKVNSEIMSSRGVRTKIGGQADSMTGRMRIEYDNGMIYIRGVSY